MRKISAKRRAMFWPVLISGVLIFTALLHAGLWFWKASIIRQEITYLYAEAAIADITIEGDFPVIDGYPLTHRITFSGRIRDEDHTLELPHIEAAGLFLPGRVIGVTFKDGLSLHGEDFDPDLWSLEHLHIEGRIPHTLPGDFTAEDLRAWHDAGGTLDISNLELKKRDMTLRGQALIMLDEGLQPAGHIDAVITGDYVDFLNFLRGKNVLRSREALMIGAVMAGLMQDGEIRGQLSVRNRTLYLGPARLTGLPAIHWPSQNVPDRLR